MARVRLYTPYRNRYELWTTDRKEYIGRCAIMERFFENEIAYEICNVRIFDDYRRRGYATRMLKEVIKKNVNTKTLILYVYQDNTIAIHLYEKVGFKIIAENNEFDRPAWVMKYIERG